MKIRFIMPEISLWNPILGSMLLFYLQKIPISFSEFIYAKNVLIFFEIFRSLVKFLFKNLTIFEKISISVSKIKSFYLKFSIFLNMIANLIFSWLLFKNNEF